MKDAQGHGSAAHQGGVEQIGQHPQDIADKLHNAVMPDLSRVSRAPSWIEWLGARQRALRTRQQQ